MGKRKKQQPQPPFQFSLDQLLWLQRDVEIHRRITQDNLNRLTKPKSLKAQELQQGHMIRLDYFNRLLDDINVAINEVEHDKGTTDSPVVG